MTDSTLGRYAANPRAFTIKKWVADILQGRAGRHDAVIERVAVALVTDRDLQEFGKFVADVYETAYLKAVNDYRTEFERYGVKVNIVADRRHPSEKSGVVSDGTAVTT